LREENLTQLEILQGFPNFARAPKQQALLQHSHSKLLRTLTKVYEKWKRNGNLERRVRFLCCVSPFCCENDYLKRNTINLSYMMKENEQACSYGVTMDRGLHHGQSVVSSLSVFFCSFFLPLTWWVGLSVGSQVILNYGQLWGEMVKKNLKYRKEPYSSVKPKKRV